MLKDILSISGKPGLFKFVSQGRNGIIVESLADKKRLHAHATARVSSLEDITVFTEEGELALAKVMKKIKENEEGNKALNAKKASADELKAYFEEILPEYDKERVYVSDIKKIISWYNILHEHDLLDMVEEEEKKEEKGAGQAEGNKEEKTAEDQDNKEQA
jgi:hypothetical protein